MPEFPEVRTQFKTVWIVLVAAAGLIVWDLYARHVPGATISEIFVTTARAHPVFSFAFGVLMGHLFWPQVEPRE